MNVTGHDSLKARRTLEVEGRRYDYFSLPAAAGAAGLGDISRLPFSLKVLLENLVRLENGRTVTVDDITAMGAFLSGNHKSAQQAWQGCKLIFAESRDGSFGLAVDDAGQTAEFVIRGDGQPGFAIDDDPVFEQAV